ncbi:hypothetical protein QQF64_000256 [Cirrhinus molitorella]|uniref:Uncharacterized protein n=1 Tax=Cirrhinus molitorella TaxID=172907 RepID=A0ABR3NXM8_9TELE
MSQKEEREEDTASKVSCDHPTKSQPSAFSGAEMTSEPNVSKIGKKRQRSESPEPSGVSMKSNTSMFQPPELSDGPVTSDPRDQNQSLQNPAKPTDTHTGEWRPAETQRPAQKQHE